MGIRTPDIQLAKLALYQLSYTPAVRRQSRLETLNCLKPLKGFEIESSF